VGDPVAKHDVEHESDAVGEREDESQLLTREPDIGEHGHSADGQHEREQVAPAAGSGRGEDHRAEELDGAHCGQREPVNSHVEE
jgi:hypothetical protein